VFYQPHHPYTKGLLESIPSSSGAGDRLRPIPGTPPSLINLPPGCKFHPRCGYVFDRCLKEEPVLVPVAGTSYHTSACWLPTAAVGLSAEVEELREETVLQQRGDQAADVAATAVAELGVRAELGITASDEGGVA
jgi:peptide/nickel transport system ATP-binding protein